MTDYLKDKKELAEVGGHPVRPAYGGDAGRLTLKQLGKLTDRRRLAQQRDAARIRRR